MDIYYSPFFRSSSFKDRRSTVNDDIVGYIPKYNIKSDKIETEPEDDVVSVESDIEEIKNPKIDLELDRDNKSSFTDNVEFRSKKEFKDTMIPIYTKLLISKGLNPKFAKALVAQDGLESAWGKKQSGRFNFGGIKGKGTVKRTREVIDGKDVYINDSFRDFDSLEDYANYKINLLNNRRYNAFSGDILEFASRVAKGGYATDPRYANILNRVIASAKNGGVLKFEGGGVAEAKDWVDNWYKNRTDQIKDNIQFNQTIPVPISGYLGYRNLKRNIDSTDISIDPSNVPEEADGVYYPYYRKIFLRHDSPSLAIHELVHSSRPTAQIKAIDKIKDILGEAFYDQKLVTDDYLDKSSEIYSRLMQLRHALGVDPKHKFTKEEIDELKKKHIKQEILFKSITGPSFILPSRTIFNKDGKVIKASPISLGDSVNPENAKSHRIYDDEGTFNILDRFSTDAIVRMLNDVANADNNKDLAIYAKLGLKIPKYEKPFGTIQNISESWQNWSNYLKPYKIDSNWRSPLLEDTDQKTKEEERKYIVKRKYDKESRNNSGDRYYDIVKQRTKDAYDALIRNGFSEDTSKILSEPLAAVSIRETGWVLEDPKNNYWGAVTGGEKKQFPSKEASWDSWITTLNKKWNKDNLRGPWYEATSIEDFVDRINNPDLDKVLDSKESYNKYNERLKKQGGGYQYMQAPHWANNNKRYNDEVRSIIDRYYGYHYME